MRRSFVAGNWKMYKTVAEARHLVSELVPGLQSIQGVEKAVCPPFTDIMAIAALLEGTDIGLGAQNMHWEESGAFTGEISPLMVSEFCQYVILGHSERRTYFGETDATVNRKLQAALAHSLKPILCVGETLEENEAGRTTEVVTRQLRQGLAGISLGSNGPLDGSLVIAYEPIWAIGTGRASSAEGANSVHAEVIRPVLAELFGQDLSQAIRILYGGSVKAHNAADFFQQPDIDGALVGGASLKVDEFTQIAQAAAR
ncbi:MAG: triose-phosphate isomerase [Anaerolineales bacterium]|jgi:triosephosphate isomerase